MVLRAVAIHELLNRTTCYRAVPWHQCVDIWEIRERETDFLARYLMDRPHAQGDWKANLSAFLNHVLDAVLRDAGLSVDYPGRQSNLRTLCEHLSGGPAEIYARGSLRDSYAAPAGPPTGCYYQDLLFPNPAPAGANGAALATGLFEDHVAVAKLLLGHTDHVPALHEVWLSSAIDRSERPRSNVLGALLDTVVRTGKLELAQPFFSSETRVTDPDDATDGLLARAVASRNIAMVKLVMDPGGVHLSHPRFGQHFETAAVLAVRLRTLDIAWYLLDSWEGTACGVLHHYGVREACYHGDIDILSCILERPLQREKDWILSFDCCDTPLELAARAGHADVVRLLLSKSLDPRGKMDAQTRPQRWACRVLGRPQGYLSIHSYEFRRQIRSMGAMFGAAVSGHVEIAEMLLLAGINLSESEWRKVTLGAIETHRTEFVRWMLTRDLLPYHNNSAMGYACVWGSVETVRLLATWGFPPNGDCLVEGRYHESLVLAALNWARPDIVDTLLQLGASPIDPLLTKFAAEWRRGEFPRRPIVKRCTRQSNFRDAKLHRRAESPY